MSAVLSHPSPFVYVQAAPPDPIIGLTEAFNADTNPKKVNLGVGVYQNAEGKVPLLNVVREAESRLLQTEGTKTYLPIDGLAVYDKAVQKLLFGADSPILTEGRAVTVQALGGTGALRVGADFLRYYVIPTIIPIFAQISSPSWENHRALFEKAGFVVEDYPYYDAATQRIDFEAMIKYLNALPATSPVVLHACCHNPTGLDLTPAQWQDVASLCKEKNLLPFLDFAYQGFAEGAEADAYAVRLFAESGQCFLVAQSFSKSFSLYRERIGSLTLVTQDADESKRVLSPGQACDTHQLLQPRFTWRADRGDGAERRGTLGTVGNRTRRNARTHPRHAPPAGGKTARKGRCAGLRIIAEQRGMFSYSGLTKEQVLKLRTEAGLYIVDSGRICVAALNEGNIGYVCDAIASVL